MIFNWQSYRDSDGSTGAPEGSRGHWEYRGGNVGSISCGPETDVRFSIKIRDTLTDDSRNTLYLP